MRTSHPRYSWTYIPLLGLALFALSDLFFFDMAFLQRAKDLLRGQGSSHADQDDTPLDGGVRSIYWKADLRRDVDVTRNFYHETGQHGYVVSHCTVC